VTAYAQYIVFYKNISSSSGGTVMSMKCSTNGGSSFVSNINTRNTQFNVDNATTSSSVTSVGSGFIWNEVWNSTSNGTNGVIGIAGTSYGGVNRRLSWWAIGAGQTPPNQGFQLSMGQTQEDGSQYNYVSINMNAGTFNNSSTFLICGVKD
jgi:hypothetical protein